MAVGVVAVGAFAVPEWERGTKRSVFKAAMPEQDRRGSVVLGAAGSQQEKGPISRGTPWPSHLPIPCHQQRPLNTGQHLQESSGGNKENRNF